jgi:hypothetical protein
MNRHHTLAWFAFSVASAALITSASAQTLPTEPPKSDPEYIKVAKAAAPDSIADKATIIRMQDDGNHKTLQTGSNGFTCAVESDGSPFCADANAMEWFKAIGAKAPPPNKTGFVYMLAGDNGTSNHDPYATDKSHWVKTGPHVMIVGAAAREMASLYPRSMDPDPSQAYVMFPGTQYEHLMLPAQGKELATR